MRMFLLLLVLVSGTAQAVPPLPVFPESLRPEPRLGGTDVPANVEVVAFGAEPVDAAVITARVTGDLVGVVPLGCCALRLDFVAVPGAIDVDVSGPQGSLAAEYNVLVEDDTTPPATPAEVLLDELIAVSFIGAPVESFGAGGVETRASFSLDDDGHYVVVLNDEDDEIGFLAARPGNRTGVSIGAPLVPDSDELCVRLIAVDAAGNRSAPSERACARLPEILPAPDCSCTTTKASQPAAFAIALLAWVSLRRKRG